MYVIYAHRGASEYYPENTLSSFYAGVDMGANGIETDVQKTKDGVLVLFHDDTVDRVTDGSGDVSDFTYAELMELTVKNEKYNRTDKIVTFEDFLKYICWRDLTIAVEIKDEGIAAEVIDMLEKYNMRDKTIITSFIYSELVAAYEYSKDYRLGYLYIHTNDESIAQLKAINAYQACPEARYLEKEHLEIIAKNGFGCRTWGIFNDEIMRHAADLEVEGGMTVNFPDRLMEYLASKE